jgi:hypothetical protein
MEKYPPMAAILKTVKSLLFVLVFVGSIAAQDFLPELVKRIKPSSVAIETFDARGNTLSRGSGFFVAPDRIVTNRHVIEKSSRVEIHLMDGKKFIVKGVLAVDGEGDLAMLQVDVPRALAIPLPIVRTVPQEGESIVVVGNPFGLEGSVSNGIVSAVREISGCEHVGPGDRSRFAAGGRRSESKLCSSVGKNSPAKGQRAADGFVFDRRDAEEQAFVGGEILFARCGPVVSRRLFPGRGIF